MKSERTLLPVFKPVTAKLPLFFESSTFDPPAAGPGSLLSGILLPSGRDGEPPPPAACEGRGSSFLAVFFSEAGCYLRPPDPNAFSARHSERKVKNPCLPLFSLSLHSQVFVMSDGASHLPLVLPQPAYPLSQCILELLSFFFWGIFHDPPLQLQTASHSNHPLRTSLFARALFSSASLRNTRGETPRSGLAPSDQPLLNLSRASFFPKSKPRIFSSSSKGSTFFFFFAIADCQGILTAFF